MQLAIENSTVSQRTSRNNEDPGSLNEGKCSSKNIAMVEPILFAFSSGNDQVYSHFLGKNATSSRCQVVAPEGHKRVACGGAAQRWFSVMEICIATGIAVGR